MKPLVSENYDNDKSDRSSFFKDRIMPNIRASTDGAVGAVGGAVIGAGLGLAGKKLSQKAYKTIASSDLTKQIGKAFGEAASQNHDMYVQSKKIKRALKGPVNMMVAPELKKTRSLMAAGAGAIAVGKTGHRIGTVAGNTSELKRQYVSQFGIEPSEAQLMEVAKLNPKSKIDRRISKYFYTPNTITKSTFRDIRMNNEYGMGRNERSKRPNDSLQPTYDMHDQGMKSNSSMKLAHISKPYWEKNAGIVNDVYSLGRSANKALDKSQKTMERISKIPLSSGAVAGGALLGLPAYAASRRTVSYDDNHRGLKRAGITLAGAGIGAGVGAGITKEVTDLAGGISNKLKSPRRTGSETLNNYKNMVHDIASNAVNDAKNVRDSIKNAAKILK